MDHLIPLLMMILQIQLWSKFKTSLFFWICVGLENVLCQPSLSLRKYPDTNSAQVWFLSSMSTTILMQDWFTLLHSSSLDYSVWLLLQSALTEEVTHFLLWQSTWRVVSLHCWPQWFQLWYTTGSCRQKAMSCPTSSGWALIPQGFVLALPVIL